MSIPVRCPQCLNKLKAPDDRAGRRAKCSQCGSKFRIPGPSPVTESHGDPLPLPADDAFGFDPDLPAESGTPSGRYRRTRVDNPAMRLAIRVALGGCCVVAAIGLYVLWVRFGPQPESRPTPPTHEGTKPAVAPKPTPTAGDAPVPANLTEVPAKKRPVSPGPALPPPSGGEKLLARADVSVPLPQPIEKIHTLVVGPAGSMAVAIHRSFDGFAGKGAVDTVERFALPSGVPAGKVEIPADGIPPGRIATLARDGSKLVVEGPPGTLAVWDLNRETDKPESTFVPFPKSDGKSDPIADCYYLAEDRIVAVGKWGRVTVFDAVRKVNVVETEKLTDLPAGEPLVPGKSFAVTPDGRTLAVVAGGKIYEINLTTGRVISAATALPKAATVRAVAADPAGARVLVAFTDDRGARIALYPFGSDKPRVSLFLPDALGDPVAADLRGPDCVLVAGSKDPGYLVFDAEAGKWVAYVRCPAVAGPRVRGSDRDYRLAPDGEGKTKLVGVEWPFDDYFSERDFAVNTKSIPAFVLTADGLRK